MLDLECDDYSSVPTVATVAVATAVMIAVAAADGGVTLDLPVPVDWDGYARSCRCWVLSPSHQRRAPGHGGVD